MTHKSSFKFLIHSFLLSSLLFLCCVSMNYLTNQFTGRDVCRHGNFKSVLHTICRKCISNMLLQVSLLSPLKSISIRRMELKTQARVCTPNLLVAERRKLIVSKTVLCPFLSLVLVIGAVMLVQTTGPCTKEYCLLQQL